MKEILEDEVKRECEQNIGEVIRCQVKEFDSRGIVEVKFKYHKDAEKCIQTMDHRTMNDRVLRCYYKDAE